MKDLMDPVKIIPKPPEILVVDDNVNVSRALGNLLFRAGFAPTVCTNGLEALDYLCHGAPGGAIIDIHLPDISGLVISQHLRERHGPDIPIIIVSGDTSMDNLNALPDVGATYFYSKPVRGSALVDRMRELTACHPATAEPQPL